MSGIVGDAFLALRPVAAPGFQQEAQRQVGPALQGLARGAVGLLAGGAFLNTIRQGFRLVISESEEAQKTVSITNALIEATGGVAGVSADHLGTLAEQTSALIAIDDELIQQTGNILLSFRKVRNEVGEGNDIFDRAVVLSHDLATVLGRDASAGAIQLGKALQDPIRGATALSRAGVQFTEQQKKQIEQLVKHNDLLSAQRIIIDEVATEFGGAAAAAATPMDRLGVSIGNLAEMAGEALQPVLRAVANTIGFVVEGLEHLPGPLKAVTAATLFFAGALGIAKLGMVLLEATLGVVATEEAAVAATSLAAAGSIEAMGVAGATAALELTFLEVVMGTFAVAAGSVVGGIAAIGVAIHTFLPEILVLSAAIAGGIAVFGAFQFAAEEHAKSVDASGKHLEAYAKNVALGTHSQEEWKQQVQATIEEEGLSIQEKVELIKKAAELNEAINDGTLAEEARQDSMEQSREEEKKAREEMDRLREANKKAAEAERERTAILREMSHVHREVAQAARDQRNAELSLAAGILGIQGSALSAKDASRSLSEARTKVSRLEAQGRQGTVAWKDAQEELSRAQLAAVGGQVSLAQAVADYVNENKTSGASTATAKALLEDYGAQVGLTSGEIDGLIGTVDDLIGKYKELPAGKTTTAEFESDLAERKLARYQRQLARIPHRVHTAVSFGSGDQVGIPGVPQARAGVPLSYDQAVAAAQAKLLAPPPTVVTIDGRKMSSHQGRRKVLLTGSG